MKRWQRPKINLSTPERAGRIFIGIAAVVAGAVLLSAASSVDHLHGGMGHGAHHWMTMMICCVPMIIIAVVLVATGTVGATFIFGAVMCVAMMWLMMRAMPGGNDT